jgi:hypothetical protein
MSPSSKRTSTQCNSTNQDPSRVSVDPEHLDCLLGHAPGSEGERLLPVRSLWATPAPVSVLLRARYLRWSATDEEVNLALSGDELTRRGDLTATRAVTVCASSDVVWPWIAQLGQGQGGFYSYDFLENLVGCDIHSADRVVPEWQYVAVGDEVRLAPQLSLIVAFSSRDDHSLSAAGCRSGALSPSTTSPGRSRSEMARTTRRDASSERYAYTRHWARPLVEPSEAVSFVMSQKMFRGIKARVERTAAPHSGHCEAPPAPRARRRTRADRADLSPATSHDRVIVASDHNPDQVRPAALVWISSGRAG